MASSYNDSDPEKNNNMMSFMPQIDLVPTRLNNLTTGLALRITNQKRLSMPPAFIPGDKDVVSGRGKRNWNHPGNVNFRNVIRNNTPRYIDAPSKNDKTVVVISIVDEIRASGGRFLNEDLHGRWYDIGDALARDKVGHSLRDQVSALSRQKNKKQALQKLEQAQQHQPVAAPLQIQRTNSFQSDSGKDMDVRKSSHSTSSILNTFARRPSFLALSFDSHKSNQERASNLMGGDPMASFNLDAARRSSAWEFMEGLDEFLDEVQQDGLLDLSFNEPMGSFTMGQADGDDQIQAYPI